MNKTFLARKTDTIFIVLGNECNLNCRYCLQHPLVHNQISHEINPDIYDFISQVYKENNGYHLTIQFFGGEPLLFFNNIKQIVHELSEVRGLTKNLSYSCMTNGKLITKEMVDFFSKYQFWVCVSYDGYRVEETRGFNAFKKGSKSRDLLFSLDGLGVSSVLSSYAYPKDICDAVYELDLDYMKLHDGTHLYMNVDELMDTGGLPEDLTNIDLDRVYSEVHDMTIEFINDLGKELPPEHYTRNVFISERYRNLNRFYSPKIGNGVWNDYYCCCGNGYSTLNLGLDGTLYPCHNTSISVGTIYDNYYRYLNKVLKYDTTLIRREHCSQCPAISFCHGGCKMIPPDKRDFYCNIKKAVYLPILNVVKEYGSAISNTTRKEN